MYYRDMACMVPHLVGAQLCGLSPVDAHTVALKIVHAKMTRHYSRYCAAAFCYVHKCELSYLCPVHDVKRHPNRVKFDIIGCVGSGFDIGEGANVLISKYVIRLASRLLHLYT